MIVSDRSPPGRPASTGSLGSSPSAESVPTIRKFSAPPLAAWSTGASALPNWTRPIELSFE